MALLLVFDNFEKRVRIMALAHVKVKLSMTTSAVGPIVAPTCSGAIGDPARFKSSKHTSAHFDWLQWHQSRIRRLAAESVTNPIT